jgi:hypothetical protein
LDIGGFWNGVEEVEELSNCEDMESALQFQYLRLSDDFQVPLNVPSFAVFALAKEDNTVRLVVIRSTKSLALLNTVSINPYNLAGLNPHFSSRYNSPKLTNAVSYSRTAASEVTEGGLEMMSLYCASAFFGSVFASFLASAILAESAGAMMDCVVVVDREYSVSCLQRLALRIGAVPEAARVEPR